MMLRRRDVATSRRLDVAMLRRSLTLSSVDQTSRR